MAINLGTEIVNDLEAQGAITTSTTLAGDLSGLAPNPTVEKVQGISIPSSGYSDGLGWRYIGGQMVLATLLTEDSSFSGDISGSQSAGLTLNALAGVSLEVSNPTAGQIIKYNGSNWGLANDTGGYEVVVTSSSVTAATKTKIFANTTSGAITVTCPSSPTNGDNFFVYDSHGQAGTNAVTIAVPAGSSIEGNVDETLAVDLDNAVIEMYYNGSTWKYYVISVRP